MSSYVDDRTKALVEQPSRVVLQGARDPRDDAAAERQKATFDPQELAAYMNDGLDKLQRKERLAKLLEQQTWGDKTNRYFLTRNEEYTDSLKAAVGIWNQMRKDKLSVDEGIDMRGQLFMPGGLELHIGMFIPTIMSQGTDEQQAKWIPMCNRLQIIGTYAQTELGHGTFVRGLETVAVFDEQSKQFVIHSPTLTATKWWPGGLGKTATHVICMARLFLKNKDYGPHAFVVQIRDLETHLPLPGIEVGDIGPKMGFNGVDNGFLRFTYVRVPHDAMLMRFAKVSEDGQYTPPPPDNQKASYATMVYVRATIVRDAGDFLGRAVTIATRYTAVRRQTASRAGQPELQVLDYDNVQQTLLPMIARSYALQFMGKSMMKMYNDFEASRNKGDFAILPELHALSSGLKSLCTDIASWGVETCRRTCGGHGFLLSSGLPTLFISYVQNVTWEGENNVMYLQAARYLVKALMAAESGRELGGSVAYLAEARQLAGAKCMVGSSEDWRSPAHQLAALKHVATRLAVQAVQVLMKAAGGKLAFEGEPWNSSSVDLIRLAKAHCVLVMHQTFVEAVGRAASERHVGPDTALALKQLAALHGVVVLNEASGDLLEGSYITGRQASQLREQQRALVRMLRPNAVALVDGFGYTDFLLNSALGRKDGNVYQALYDSARGSPLNATLEGPAWRSVLEPLLNPKARAAARSRM
ncbi:hypothetical protein N2152v2_007436 [Parachlorella kessleri]